MSIDRLLLVTVLILAGHCVLADVAQAYPIYPPIRQGLTLEKMQGLTILQEGN